MKIDILTIFPGMFEGPLTESIIKKAREKHILDINIHDIRSFTQDKHHSADDRPFGGGPGMVMKAEPIYEALKSVGAVSKKTATRGKSSRRPLVVYLSPQGETLSQKLTVEMAACDHLVLLCGHYEGIDERVMRWVDREISIGDYVLTGGELPAMVLIDAVSRLLPGVVKEISSVEQDSFYRSLLDCPHYTRPAVFQKITVPEVLLSGDHVRVEKWRWEQSLLRTAQRRPDLLKQVALTKDDKEIIATVTRSLKSKSQGRSRKPTPGKKARRIR